MPEIRKTTIPGVGTCQDFATDAGRRLGVVRRASHRRELVVYSRSDPDAVEWSVDLDADESDLLAELLATTSFVQHEGTLDGLIEGLALDWVPIPEGAIPTTIGELGIRKRTGATVVAITGPGGAVPAPGPDHVLAPGDTAVVVGTPDGINQAVALLSP